MQSGPAKQLLITSIILLILSGSLLYASYPAAIDIPSGPAAVKPPGLQVTIDLSGSAAADAPEISAISDVTFPNETLVITGYNLDGATLMIWSEGNIESVRPLKTSANRMVAVMPANLPIATAIIWPVKNGKYGNPIRVNGATTWWALPTEFYSSTEKQKIEITGKNLALKEGCPKVYLKGPGFSGFIDVNTFEPYHIQAEIPANLKNGKYNLWVHNSTGGKYGWSEAVSFTVKENPYRKKTSQFNVEDFGAKADDELDDSDAIQKAVDKAKNSGGVINFSQGRYIISKAIKVQGENIHLQGLGKGVYDNGKLSGKFTYLSFDKQGKMPASIIEIFGKDCSVKDMAVENGNDGDKQTAIGVYAKGALIDNVCLIMFDYRDWGYDKPGPPAVGKKKIKGAKVSKKIIDSGVLFIDTFGVAGTTFINSEVHAVGPGVRIGKLQPYYADEKRDKSSDEVLIRNVKFRGYYAGEPDLKSNTGASGRAVGVVIYNGKKVMVEKCDFASADRYHRKIMCRTVLSLNQGNRNFYFAHNHSMNMNSHPSAVGMDINQGEQYLFHWRYPYGGLFNVSASDRDRTTITTANIEPLDKGDKFANPHYFWNTHGSRVLDEVGQNDHWILFICKGKGVGQYRQIKSKKVDGDKVEFTVEAPWRVAPDSTSRVNLIVAYRKIIVYHNYVDTGKNIETHKSHGVCFWFYAFENIVANNTFRNMTAGVIFNSRYRGPTAWNLTRENIIENMSGYVGDTSLSPAFYVDHFRMTSRWANPEDRVWYSVGNICRSNFGSNSDVGAYLHTRFTGQIPGGLPPEPHPDSGVMMSVIENNQFVNVKKGIVLSSPVNWAVLRNNFVVTIDSNDPLIYDQNGDKGAKDTININNIKTVKN